MKEQTFVLKFSDDVRECTQDKDHFIHILQPNFRIHKDDPRIISITPVKPPQEEKNDTE